MWSLLRTLDPMKSFSQSSVREWSIVLALVPVCTTSTLRGSHRQKKLPIASTRCLQFLRATSSGSTLTVASRHASTLKSSLPLATWLLLPSSFAPSWQVQSELTNVVKISPSSNNISASLCDELLPFFFTLILGGDVYVSISGLLCGFPIAVFSCGEQFYCLTMFCLWSENLQRNWGLSCLRRGIYTKYAYKNLEYVYSNWYYNNIKSNETCKMKRAIKDPEIKIDCYAC